MTTNNDHIRQLLDMLDNPEAYTEQEIHDIIHRDKDTLNTYHMMVDLKRSSLQRQADTPVDVDAAWQKLQQQLQPKPHRFGWMKVAASFIGLLLVSGIAFAAIQIFHHISETNEVPTETVSVNAPVSSSSPQQAETDSTQMSPVVFEDTELAVILSEMSRHYHYDVAYKSEATKHIRLYFTWDKKMPIDDLVDTFNKFERIHITLENQKLIVE